MTERPAPRWAWWVATGFGSGRLRPAPGTWGSLAALAAWILFSAALPLIFVNAALQHPGQAKLLTGYGALQLPTSFRGLPALQGAPWLAAGYWALELLFLLLPLAMTWLSVKAADAVSRETGQKDPSWVVSDEWAGMWIALWPLRWELAASLPLLGGAQAWRLLPMMAVPFLAFRLFDIWKPWPVDQVQVLPGGQGITADDVVAGLYALAVTALAAPWVRELAVGGLGR